MLSESSYLDICTKKTFCNYHFFITKIGLFSNTIQNKVILKRQTTNGRNFQGTTNRSMGFQPHWYGPLSVVSHKRIPTEKIWHHNKVSRQSNLVGYLPAR
jgi:hypothetical protein